MEPAAAGHDTLPSVTVQIAHAQPHPDTDLEDRRRPVVARAGDTAVCEAITRTATWLGIGIANMVTALHPEMVVLSGSVAALDDLLLEPVRQAVKERVRMFPVEDLRIERSMFEDKAGLLGGLALYQVQRCCVCRSSFLKPSYEVMM